ncbi:hypothetical protein C8J57DRAFT_1247139 [Mycena rebaudengoi]|nr:hypothetical protein C8J57DRAFT_1247139 [Mycena rebaudengoi]
MTRATLLTFIYKPRLALTTTMPARSATPKTQDNDTLAHHRAGYGGFLSPTSQLASRITPPIRAHPPPAQATSAARRTLPSVYPCSPPLRLPRTPSIRAPVIPFSPSRSPLRPASLLLPAVLHPPMPAHSRPTPADLRPDQRTPLPSTRTHTVFTRAHELAILATYVRGLGTVYAIFENNICCSNQTSFLPLVFNAQLRTLHAGPHNPGRSIEDPTRPVPVHCLNLALPRLFDGGSIWYSPFTSSLRRHKFPGSTQIEEHIEGLFHS